MTSIWLGKDTTAPNMLSVHGTAPTIHMWKSNSILITLAMSFNLVSCSRTSCVDPAASRWSDPSLPLLSPGGWFWGRGQRTRLNEFQAKCQRSQGRAPRQRMARQSMHPLASSIPIRGSLWKPRKLQVNPLQPFLLLCNLLYKKANEQSFWF